MVASLESNGNIKIHIRSVIAMTKHIFYEGLQGVDIRNFTFYFLLNIVGIMLIELADVFEEPHQ